MSERVESKIDLSVSCIIIDEARARTESERGNVVWTWCARGMENWVVPGVMRSDVLTYLLVDEIPLPPDAEEYLPSEDENDG